MNNPFDNLQAIFANKYLADREKYLILPLLNRSVSLVNGIEVIATKNQECSACLGVRVRGLLEVAMTIAHVFTLDEKTTAEQIEFFTSNGRIGEKNSNGKMIWVKTKTLEDAYDKLNGTNIKEAYDSLSMMTHFSGVHAGQTILIDNEQTFKVRLDGRQEDEKEICKKATQAASIITGSISKMLRKEYIKAK